MLALARQPALVDEALCVGSVYTDTPANTFKRTNGHCSAWLNLIDEGGQQVR